MATKIKKTLIEVAKLVVIGNSKGVVLPKDWLDTNKVQIGDRLMIKVEKI